MTCKELISLTTDRMSSIALENDRVQMMRYMKNQFDFYGVKSPNRKIVEKDLKVIWKEYDNDTLIDYAEKLWELPQRELQYIAVSALSTRSRKLEVSQLPRIEKLILSKSWWDTVDALSPNIAGSIFYRNPEIKMGWIDKWNSSENMWLNRSAIIHQLRYKEDVDLDLMFALIETHIGSKEFFINKAGGWALRQASKFYPLEIKQFIENHPNLSNLTKKEGSKYL